MTKRQADPLLTVLISLSAGIIGTLVVIKYIPDRVENIHTNKTVSITENNTIKEAINEIYDAVVLVETYNNNSQISSGTGFVYKKDDTNGYIITNHHVIEDGNKFIITLTNGQEAEAKVLGSDKYSDIAVLSISQDAVLQTAKLGESENSEIGDTVFTIGSPLGKEYMGTVTKGILSGKNRTVTVSSTTTPQMIEVLQTDAAINPGNSGGPLVNINGEVIGVTSMKLVKDEVEGMGFAIPIEIVNTLLERLESGQKIERPIIGVEMTDISNTYYLYRKGITVPQDAEKGVVITKVNENYPAQKAGLEKGDIILAINDTEIDDSTHFKYILYKFKIGEEIKIKYLRNNQVKETTLKLDKSQENN